MTTGDLLPRTPPLDASALWGDTFLNRFEWNVRNSGRIRCPDSGEEIRLDRNMRAQSFRRLFGEVIQFAVAAGRIGMPRLHLAAVALRSPEGAESEARRAPALTTLRQISGAEGLDFQDGKFYCVGVFSPGGWPGEWTQQAELRGNALFYLVEKGEGTRWRVFGPQDPLRALFDPESGEEKAARARTALADSVQLVLPGDSVALDSFLQEHGLDRAAVESAIRAGSGRYRIVEYKGRPNIQRSVP
jgi:hypothetical protein